MRELIVASNSISHAGASHIAQALHINESLEMIDLSNNQIKDIGAMAFATMLQVNKSLFELKLSGCDLGSQSLIGLSTVLQANTTIKSLNISDNRSNFSTLTQSMLTTVMVHLSKTIAYSTTLRKLVISKLGITDWIVVDYLADALSVNKSLIELDVGRNRIGQDGGIALAKALEKNDCLEILKLSRCGIQEAGAKAFMTMLSVNKSLKRYISTPNFDKSIFLEHNGINGQGLCYLAQGIKKNSSLETLQLWGNQFDERASRVRL